MQDGFLVVDAQGFIRQHNAKCEALVGGISSDGGQSLYDAVPQLAQFYKDWQQDRSQIFPVIRSNRTQKEIQVRFVAIGGADDASILNSNTSPQNVLLSPTVIFLEDAGRIRAQAQQLKLAALGRLTANIAHEIRNPLSSINHAAELLQEDIGRSRDDIRLLSIIRDNSFRLDRMVQEVLYLNRRDRAHPETIDPRPYLETFLRDFCANEKSNTARFDLQITTTKNIVFDRSHLDQVLWNLVRNAARYANDNPGAIRVILRIATNINIALSATEPVPQTAELLVCDNGTGVPADTIAHLFEPFFTTDSQGTGLGLYVARELSEVNNALLDYLPVLERDDNLGEGGCFRLTLQVTQ
jgi:two-component system, NtrC family, sensor histidine kinase PilS